MLLKKINESQIFADLFVVCLLILTIYLPTKKQDLAKINRHPPSRSGVQARILGEELVKNYKGNGKCLVIHHPTFPGGYEYHKTDLKNLKKGLGDKIEIRAVPIKSFDSPEEAMGEEAMGDFKAEDFNKITRANQDCDIVITLVPLPYSEDELIKMDIFKMIEDPGNPKNWIKDPSGYYPRLGIHNGYIGKTGFLFDDNLIYAMSLWRPNPNEISSTEFKKLSDREAFNHNYLLITPANIDSVKKEYPQLFPKKR